MDGAIVITKKYIITKYYQNFGKSIRNSCMGTPRNITFDNLLQHSSTESDQLCRWNFEEYHQSPTVSQFFKKQLSGATFVVIELRDKFCHFMNREHSSNHQYICIHPKPTQYI